MRTLAGEGDARPTLERAEPVAPVEPSTAAGEDDRPPEAEPPDRLLVRSQGRAFFLPFDDIDWVEARGNYARIRAGTSAHVIRRTMTSLESVLPRHRFARIHRRTIVNLDRIRDMQVAVHGDSVVTLLDGTTLRLSRRYRDRLMTRTP